MRTGKQWKVGVGPVILLTIFLWGVAQGASPKKDDGKSYINSEPQGERHFLVIGDSITRNNCLPRDHGRCGWRKFLDTECGFPKGTFTLDTLSRISRRAGEYAFQLPLLKFQDEDIRFIAEKKYEAVLIMVGVNDLGNQSHHDTLKLEHNYKNIVAALREKLKKPTPPILFLSILPYCRFGGAPRLHASQLVEKANGFLKQYAKEEEGIEFVDLYPAAVDYQTVKGKKVGCLRKDWSGPDGLHPKYQDPTQKLLAIEISRQLEKGKLLGCQAVNKSHSTDKDSSPKDKE